jgi:hypothetical protein
MSERKETRDEYLDREEQHEIEQQARFALDMANRLAAPAKREEARLRLTCAALTGIIALEGSHRADLNAERAVENADACLALLYPAVDGGEAPTRAALGEEGK